jgi:hypothetical protein
VYRHAPASTGIAAVLVVTLMCDTIMLLLLLIV